MEANYFINILLTRSS